ncbi:uncharacterized protein AAES06_018596 [Glossophaga mutica]
MAWDLEHWDEPLDHGCQWDAALLAEKEEGPAEPRGGAPWRSPVAVWDVPGERGHAKGKADPIGSPPPHLSLVTAGSSRGRGCSCGVCAAPSISRWPRPRPPTWLPPGESPQQCPAGSFLQQQKCSLPQQRDRCDLWVQPALWFRGDSEAPSPLSSLAARPTAPLPPASAFPSQFPNTGYFRQPSGFA